MTIAPPSAGRFRICLFLLSVALLGVCRAETGGTVPSGARLESDLESDPSVTPYLFEIPAPRGQILDRNGRALARNVVAWVATASAGEADSEAEFELAIRDICSASELLSAGSAAEIKEHYVHRRGLPMVVSGVLSADQAEAVRAIDDRRVGVSARYLRDYPNGAAAGHVLGYLSKTGAPLRGPLQEREPLWPRVEGVDGLEKFFDDELSGEDGLISLSFGKDGSRVAEKVIQPPGLGNDIVTTIDLELQLLLESTMAEVDRPGAGVILNPENGDILSLVSLPGYDPNLFVPSISEAEFSELSGNPDKPLLNRAVAASYPPGSIFKPFVAAGLFESGRVYPTTVLETGGQLEIDGRVFRNWTDKDTGAMAVEGALARSSNTWFYRAAMQAGGQPLLEAATQFGFGREPLLPLPAVAAGRLPSKILTNQGAANFSIGQGEVEASPVQAAMAMGGIANGNFVPAARLITNVQKPDGSVINRQERASWSMLNFFRRDMAAIRRGMSFVVNHEEGTGKGARNQRFEVFGKTGTAQWSKNGVMAPAVWFAGFVTDTEPTLSFAVMFEGDPGDRIFGGSTVAPVVGKVFEAIGREPGKYGIKINGRPEGVPLASQPIAFEGVVVADGSALGGGGEPPVHNGLAGLAPDRGHHPVGGTGMTSSARRQAERESYEDIIRRRYLYWKNRGSRR